MITTEETLKTADLIKINIAKKDEESFREALNHALDPAESFKELDTANVEILSHPTGMTTTGSEDIVEPGLSQEEALANATKDRALLGYIKVSKVIK